MRPICKQVFRHGAIILQSRASSGKFPRLELPDWFHQLISFPSGIRWIFQSIFSPRLSPPGRAHERMPQRRSIDAFGNAGNSFRNGIRFRWPQIPHNKRSGWLRSATHTPGVVGVQDQRRKIRRHARYEIRFPVVVRRFSFKKASTLSVFPLSTTGPCIPSNEGLAKTAKALFRARVGFVVRGRPSFERYRHF